MKNVAVFETETDKPVAWAFLGLDGSLSTLHVEPEHRGKGVAKLVASKLLRTYADGLAVDRDGDAWAHADVYDGNVQSEAVCRSLGASKTWAVFWVRIELADSYQ
jgi:ribosomal protein S18 acetylase RimI-like enzyme